MRDYEINGRQIEFWDAHVQGSLPLASFEKYKALQPT
jgi:hypothetical protein